ncbi:MAG TPA: 1,4-alpha-glucan branching protein GlgB [Gemmatimonadales bacterium]|nr:1,4-alpha-glucan branching protein GlgB [Gemmatimonadales bacterium]
MTAVSLSAEEFAQLGDRSACRTYRILGAHPADGPGGAGFRFAVVAPNAGRVSVIGDFNGWDPAAHPMSSTDAGVWQRFISGVGPGSGYKYRVVSRNGEYVADKADPFAFAAEMPPSTASLTTLPPSYVWGDAEWMAARDRGRIHEAPLSIYEVHLGSWRRVPEAGNRWLTYREAADQLADYVSAQGFTHVELLPLAEHPFYGSWGYQVTGYFAPTARYGSPQDLMYLVDTLHRRGIGVILDWVPAHFPRDGHGLAYFDGTHLYEHADPRQGFHPDWQTFVFNYGRDEVRSFLLSNAMFWLDRYHIDALRVDAVASMLYLDYGRQSGEWVPNRYGGRENLDAVDFLRTLNERLHLEYPGATVIAEESTSWPMVSRPTYLGGLGFGFKWNMGWMHDMLDYMGRDPVYRSHHHRNITFSMLYAFTENFILPFSHDEVVHGKGSMIARMPGDRWQRFANLRVLYGYMFGHPGKKLLFMGAEFGQWREWNHDTSLDWHLLDESDHRGLQRWVRDLNTCCRNEPALHEVDFDPAGFEWVDCNDHLRSVVSFLRRARDPEREVLFVCNFTPVTYADYRVGVPAAGHWREILNSDASLYGGSGQGNLGGVDSDPVSTHGRPWSLNLTLPPLAVVAFRSPRASAGPAAST